MSCCWDSSFPLAARIASCTLASSCNLPLRAGRRQWPIRALPSSTSGTAPSYWPRPRAWARRPSCAAPARPSRGVVLAGTVHAGERGRQAARCPAASGQPPTPEGQVQMMLIRTLGPPPAGASQWTTRCMAQEFRAFRTHLALQVPQQPVHLILDNYSTYKTQSVPEGLAAHPRWHFHFTSSPVPGGTPWRAFARSLTWGCCRLPGDLGACHASVSGGP